MTKDYLETKRSKAIALETTFVYDYPDLFKVNLKEIWKEHISKCNFAGKVLFTLHLLKIFKRTGRREDGVKVVVVKISPRQVKK